MTVKELINKLLEYDMSSRVQVAKCGKLYDVDDVWVGQDVILETICKDCRADCGGHKNAD